MGLRLTEIRINNFRSIEELNIELNDLNLLIGQNNCGKSNEKERRLYSREQTRRCSLRLRYRRRGEKQ